MVLSYLSYAISYLHNGLYIYVISHVGNGFSDRALYVSIPPSQRCTGRFEPKSTTRRQLELQWKKSVYLGQVNRQGKNRELSHTGKQNRRLSAKQGQPACRGNRRDDLKNQGKQTGIYTEGLTRERAAGEEMMKGIR